MSDASAPGGVKIKVLVVEDSPTARDLLVHILSDDPAIRVTGTASSGEEALDRLLRDRPDVITMDLHMPGMGGLEATRKIMETCPTPIVVVSSNAAQGDAYSAFNVLEAGALALVNKPRGVGSAGYETEAKAMVQTVKSMSEVKVIRRWPKKINAPATNPTPARIAPVALLSEFKLVAIGASTGGPLALKTILSELPRNFSVPILIVQHIAPGFTQGLVDWLALASGLPVHVAAHGDYMQPGHVYLAPEGLHAGIQHGGRVALSDLDKSNGHRPSVSHLFRSVATVFGRNAIGVLLTGMGKDGAEELKMMKDRGAITMAQDQRTSVVHGMPGVAVDLDAATYVLPPEDIAKMLTTLTAR